MKKMSTAEQLRELRKKRKKLRDLSIKGRMAAQQLQEEQQKCKRKKPIIVTIYER